MQKQLRGTCLHSGKRKSDGRHLRATAEDGDTKVGKTIRLITQDKKRTRVNIWNIADICAVLLSNETSTASKLLQNCLQNLANISRTDIHCFIQKETPESK